MLFRSRVKSEQDKVDNIDLLVKVKRNDFNRHNAEIESIIVDEVGGPFRNKELKHVCLIGE